MADAQAVLANMNSGDPIAAVRQLGGQYAQSAKQEEADPAIAAARKKEAVSIESASATVDSAEKAIKQDGVDLADAVKPWNADAEAKKYSTPTIEAFGSAGSVFALLASAFTHTPMINALSGSAAAINAVRAGDEQAYNRAYDAYKTNIDLAIKRHEMMSQDYKDIVDIATKKPDLAHAELASLTAKYGDEQARILAEQGQWDKVGELLNAREANAVRMKELQPQLDEAHMKNQVFFGVIDKWRVDHGAKIEVGKDGATKISGGPPQVPSEVLQQAWASVHVPQTVIGNVDLTSADLPKNATLKQIAEVMKQKDPRAYMIANYRMPPPSGFGSNNPNMKQLYADVFAMNPDYSAPRYAEINKAVSAFGAGKQGDAVRAFNVGIQHIAVAEKLASALHNNDFAGFNAAKQEFQRVFGSAAPTNFDAAKHFLATEVSKAITGSGNAGALADREELEGNINKARSWDQLSGALGTFKQFMAGQVRGYQKQYEQSTGLDNFDDMLLPETRQELDAVNAGWAPNPAWPSAKGLPDGKVVVDDQNNIVAKARGGQWVEP